MALDYGTFYGVLITRARTTLDYSRKQLAAEIGIPARELARYESGEEVPSREIIRDIAAVLVVSPYAFFDPDVFVERDEIIVRRRDGESGEDYHERLMAASPPLSADARDAIRTAGDEYWMDVRREGRRRRTG